MTLVLEAILHCKGFKNTITLSRKLVLLLRTASQLLSHDVTYNFGIPKLRVAIALASENRSSLAVGETRQIIKAMAHIFSPQMIAKDIKIFHEMLKDIFGETLNNEEEFDYDRTLYVKACAKLGLVSDDLLQSKMTDNSH